MEFKGVLSENGAPIPIETLAKMLRRRPSSVKVLEREISELVAEGVLKRHAGFTFDPAVMAATMDQLRRISGKYFRTFEEVLEKFPQVLESFGEVLGKFWEKSENEMSAQADVSNQLSEGESEKDLGKVQNSNVRNSNSTRTSTTKRSTGTTATDSRIVSALEARETSASNNGQTDSPDLPAAAGIPAAWITEVKADAKYKHLRNIDAVIEKCRAYYVERGLMLTLGKLRDWLDREKHRPAKGAPKKNGSGKRNHSADNAENKAKREAEAKRREAARKAKAAEEETLRRAEESRLKAEYEERKKALKEKEDAERKAREKREAQFRARDLRLTKEAQRLEVMPHTETKPGDTIFDLYGCSRGEFTSKEIFDKAHRMRVVIGHKGPFIGRLDYAKLSDEEKEAYAFKLPF